MASKWKFLRTQFPEARDDASYDEKVGVARTAMMAALARALRRAGALADDADPGRAPVAALLVRLKAEKKALEERETEVNLKIAALERELVEQMEATDLDKFESDGTTTSLQYEPAVKTIDKRAVREWAHRIDPDLLSVNANTLAAYVKEALEPGGSGVLPPGIDVKLRKKISQRSSTA